MSIFLRTSDSILPQYLRGIRSFNKSKCFVPYSLHGPGIRAFSGSSSYLQGPSLVGETGTSKISANNDALQKFYSKYKVLAKLQKNPRFSGYFKKLSQVGALPTITALVLLHELTAVVPLLLCWYTLYKANILGNIEITNDFLIRCTESIERLIGDKYDSFDRNRLILSGAFSYAFVKIIGPLRMLVSLWAAPYVGKYLIVPFYKLKRLLKK
ncbi:hypothetical protein KAFR_0H01470 [Kazachstania africana CBS 2517]|uniref:Uncharacterized protein n=1 Tax=Kazachstania africana (strain ATCC 22294 / BCRC 22015 / CBS 2517 / CECT 1963 / NBRC 1671 / NRRL Y-8276) TaxID=1071382 RepID=H2AZ01_KAZAF|nr:hypothetical protein KAFR_0H01470 [Kazachstania africana CBS 2517]CCF59557.1 hypothetical protein KAFR_0H01470 [Kazachstania africana CBS 2517]